MVPGPLEMCTSKEASPSVCTDDTSRLHGSCESNKPLRSGTVSGLARARQSVWVDCTVLGGYHSGNQHPSQLSVQVQGAETR